jgi:outer membrane biosynthesis protein TonB
MKKNILIAMITMIFFGVIATGYGKTPAELSAISSSKEIRKIITKSIKYPDFGYKKDMYGDVEITFTVSEEGTIDIKKISSENDELKNYVKEQISNITIKDVSHPVNQKYSVKLAFWPS